MWLEIPIALESQIIVAYSKWDRPYNGSKKTFEGERIIKRRTIIIIIIIINSTNMDYAPINDKR
jgi:hypothetical protein